MSAVPARPTSPDRVSSPVAELGRRHAAVLRRATARRPGSTLPDRVAITSPSSGVKPIVVSTERPPRTAASEAPAPRWQVTIRRPAGRRRGPAAPPPAAQRTRATARGTRNDGSPIARASSRGIA